MTTFCPAKGLMAMARGYNKAIDKASGVM